jgi:SAM-dependent methyltransferase
MCSWETALEGSQFDDEVESDGFPTRYERLVWTDHKPLEDVTCPVCGMQKQTVRFVGSDLREEGKCSHCGSYNRLRQLADIILPEASRLTGHKLQALQDLVHTNLRILNTQCQGVLHTVLKRAPGYVCSEYINSDIPAGQVIEHIRHEDLQRTTFKDEVFDLVVSTDLMSRIPRPYQGFHELRRILRPGGAHIFTVPFSPGDYHDQIRAVVEDGKLVHWALPPIYQGDHLHPKGVLMFTIFGREMADKLCMLGYNTTVHHLHNAAHGIIGDNAWVVSTVKNTEHP